MANAARKARKSAGIPFVKAQKVGTPVAERAWFNTPFQPVPGTKLFGRVFTTARMSQNKQRALLSRAVATEVSE